MNEREYLPQLDSLRAFAVLGVLIAHNWHPAHLPGPLAGLDFGDIGVRLFFGLSGFLITRILIGCRDRADDNAGTSLHLIGRFYIRRFLRIFPIYYLVLAVAIIVNLSPARERWIWLMSYSSNIYVTLAGDWLGRLSHFWTLAVEEQFYLFWPWLMIFAPRKALIPLVSVLIGLAPLYRLWVTIRFPADIAAGGAFAMGTFTLACIDGLGMGALLALVLRSGARREAVYTVLNKAVLPVGILSVIILHEVGVRGWSGQLYYTFWDLALAILFCWLVAATSRGFRGPVGRFLESKPLVYIGKITYGIYVYHYLVPVLLAFVLGKLGLAYSLTGFRSFLISSVVTVIVAALSWELLERPINNLKRHFSYSLPRPALAPVAAAEGAVAQQGATPN